MSDARQQTPADEIRAAFAAKAEEIKSRRDLSGEGRDIRLAGSFAKLRKQMAELRRKDSEREERNRAAKHKKHFGNAKSWDSASIISSRDAQDRADRVKSADEAAALLERAIMSDDEILGRAVALRAFNHAVKPELGDSWSPVVHRWIETQPPGTAEDISELADIAQAATDPKARFARNMYYTLPTPGELVGKNIDGLASQAEGLPE